MLHSLHLLETSPARGLRVLAQRRAPKPPGLRHAEYLSLMPLGAPILSPRRAQLRQVAMIAAWDFPDDLDRHLVNDPIGRWWAEGWHVRLAFLRRWGAVTGFDDLPANGPPHDPTEPVVAVTFARLALTQIPRFIRWGQPVETLVRDDPGQTLALAGAAPARSVATFTVWRSAQAMTDMVSGRTNGAATQAHVAAMAERERKDFHREFTTLRFRCLAEHGSWQGRTDIVPRPS